MRISVLLLILRCYTSPKTCLHGEYTLKERNQIETKATY